MKYTCQCCGYKTLTEGTRDSYEICKVCYWEDDLVQNEDEDYEGGANEVSLRQAQNNFKLFGVSEVIYKNNVVKPVVGGYTKDEDFKPLDIKLSAEVYRIGVLIGLLNIQDVIKWADNVIEQCDTPPYEIIELSFSAKEKLEDITLRLMEIRGDFDDNDLSPKVILGLLNQYLNTPEDIANVIEKLDKLIEYLPDSYEGIEMEIHFLTDGFYLAEENIYGDLKEVHSNLKEFLIRFIDYTKYLA